MLYACIWNGIYVKLPTCGICKGTDCSGLTDRVGLIVVTRIFPPANSGDGAY